MAVNRPRPDYGNGPPCPDNPSHGHTYALTRGDWCPVTASFVRRDALRGGVDEAVAPARHSDSTPEHVAPTAGG